VAGRTDPEAWLASRDRVAALADLYGALLTPRQREVLSLYYEDDLSLAEVAARAGVSRQAVHDLLRRAAAALEGYESRLRLLARAAERRKAAAELVAVLEEAVGGPPSVRPARLRRALDLARGLAEP
jgi:predicted DNA-binding protein YlxM (UPF0122 family)